MKIGGVVVGEYAYDAFGRRTKKVASGITTLYHYDFAGNLIAETDENGTPQRDYTLHLEYDSTKQDQYGRTLAYVFLEDGTMVNAKLIEEGYAHHVLPCESKCKYDLLLLKKQNSAMDAKKGIWKNWKETPSEYIGNNNSKRFHTESCPFGQKTGKNKRVSFSKKWDAFYQGFAPCKKCNP